MGIVGCGHGDQETDGRGTTGHAPRLSSSGQTRRGSELETEGSLRGREGPTSEQEQETACRHLKLLIRYLYAGHFLARWGARTWEFSVGLQFVSVWQNSVLFAATYSVVESASTALFGAVIGRWVDRSTYAKVLQFWLVTQNFSFLIAGSTVIALLVYSNRKSQNFMAFILLVILANVSGAVGILSTLAGTILVERGWR